MYYTRNNKQRGLEKEGTIIHTQSICNWSIRKKSILIGRDLISTLLNFKIKFTHLVPLITLFDLYIKLLINKCSNCKKFNVQDFQLRKICNYKQDAI